MEPRNESVEIEVDDIIKIKIPKKATDEYL